MHHHHVNTFVDILQLLGGLLVSSATAAAAVLGPRRWGREAFWGRSYPARGNFRVGMALGLFVLGLVWTVHAITAL